MTTKADYENTMAELSKILGMTIEEIEKIFEENAWRIKNKML